MTLSVLFTTLAAVSGAAFASPASDLEARASPSIVASVQTNDTTYYYRGCYDELKSSARALNHNLTDSLPGPVTVETCADTCFSQNYTIAGVMYGNWCYCDNALSSVSPVLSDDQCSNPCAGNTTEACGGVWHYDIYYTNQTATIPIPAIPEIVGTNLAQYNASGCWVDNPSNRTLDGDYLRDDNMTPDTCIAYCYSKNMRMAGLEYGIECFCGQGLLDPALTDTADCNKACGGDSSLACGSENRIQLYIGVDTRDVLEPKMMAGNDTSNLYISIGCYSDRYDLRALGGYNFEEADMTADLCVATCSSKDYKYAGIELGTQCFCGSALSAYLQVDSSHCDTPCGGDSIHSCGGGLRLDVYEAMNWTEPPSTGICGL